MKLPGDLLSPSMKIKFQADNDFNGRIIRTVQQIAPIIGFSDSSGSRRGDSERRLDVYSKSRLKRADCLYRMTAKPCRHTSPTSSLHNLLLASSSFHANSR